MTKKMIAALLIQLMGLALIIITPLQEKTWVEKSGTETELKVKEVYIYGSYDVNDEESYIMTAYIETDSTCSKNSITDFDGDINLCRISNDETFSGNVIYRFKNPQNGRTAEKLVMNSEEYQEMTRNFAENHLISVKVKSLRNRMILEGVLIDGVDAEIFFSEKKE